MEKEGKGSRSGVEGGVEGERKRDKGGGVEWGGVGDVCGKVGGVGRLGVCVKAIG